jgi:hypothetical protein
MPVGLIATVTILLPLTWLAGNRMPWWVPTLVGAAAGQVLLIVYAHLLSPHGTFAFAPGDGALAGATNGLVFWWIALRRPRDWQPPQSAGE